MAPKFTPSQLSALAIVPKVTSSLSMLGSGYIAHRVWSVPRHRTKIHHRLLGAMSVFDVLSSFAYFLSTWPMPADKSPFPYSVGNEATCAAQGLLIQAGHTVLAYNACLAVYYWVAVRCEFDERLILRGRWTGERIMHIVAIGYPNLGGLIAVFDGSMWIAGPVGCWINSIPSGCSGSSCIRGPRAAAYKYAFAVFPTLACLAIATGAYVSQCLVVRCRNREAAERAVADPNCLTLASRRTAAVLERLITRQALLYIAAAWFTWATPLALRWYFTVTGKIPFGLISFFAVVIPLQGVFNFLVFCRPAYLGVCGSGGEVDDDGGAAYSGQDQQCFRDEDEPAVGSKSDDYASSSGWARSFVRAEDQIDHLSHNMGELYAEIKRTTVCAETASRCKPTGGSSTSTAGGSVEENEEDETLERVEEGAEEEGHRATVAGAKQ